MIQILIRILRAVASYLEKKYSPEVVRDRVQNEIDSSSQEFADSVAKGDEDKVSTLLDDVVNSSKTQKKV